MCRPRTREPHPWNTAFRWELPDRAPTTITSEQRAQFDAYVRQTASTSGASNADELAKLADLKDKGVITQADFDTAKAKLLA